MSNTVTIVSSTAIPTSSDVSILDLGKASTVGHVNTGNLTFTGGSVVFGTTAAGVYQGSVSGVSSDPVIGNIADPDNYFAAEGSGGSVTINFAAPQEYFGLLWGSVDAYNTLTFYDANGVVVDTVTGPEVLLAEGSGAKAGATSVYVNINIPGGYSKVVASATQSAFELGSITYAPSTVSNPTTPGTPTVVIPNDSNGHPLCFLGGTHIATPDGEVPVETLAAGDLVRTADGGVAPVRWVGLKTVSTLFADKLRMMPIRITAGALGGNLPHRDLLVSPDHAMLIDGILVQAAALANGGSIRQETAMPERFTYYHIELASHELILAEGAASETFVDNAGRMAFDNWQEHQALFGEESAVAEMPYPRAKAARQVPAAIRTRLAGAQAA
jgi:hypothetical protein